MYFVHNNIKKEVRYFISFHFLDRNLHLYDSSAPLYTPIKQEKGKDIDWSILDAAFTPDGTTVIFSSWSNNSE